MAAHRAAVTDALALVQSRALFTRTGKDGCAQVTTRGMVAAGFEHPDTRAGDPSLHTHVVLANRVQAGDGRWRTVEVGSHEISRTPSASNQREPLGH